MRVVDANVLLYAVNADAEHHHASRLWLDRALAGADTIGLTWLVLLTFIRIATKVALFPSPLSTSEALAQVHEWMSAPGAHILHPGGDHFRVLNLFVGEVGTGGNLVNDAHLAAIALERRAEVVSYDAGFGRFGGVRWRRPDDLL